MIPLSFNSFNELNSGGLWRLPLFWTLKSQEHSYTDSSFCCKILHCPMLGCHSLKSKFPLLTHTFPTSAIILCQLPSSLKTTPENNDWNLFVKISKIYLGEYLT